MNIIWQYLDKRSATINAVKDYGSMKSIIENTSEEIRNVEESMVSFASPVISDMPKGTRNLNATEDRILRGIDEIDCLKERYRQAQEYMAWFVPTWKALSEDERYCLKTVYWSDNDEKQIDLIMDICDYFGIERTTAYNNKNKAVDHLSLLLYGK